MGMSGGVLDYDLEAEIGQRSKEGDARLLISRYSDDGGVISIMPSPERIESHPDIGSFIEGYFTRLGITPQVVTSGVSFCHQGDVFIAHSDAQVINDGGTVVLFGEDSVARGIGTFVKVNTSASLFSRGGSETLDISTANGSSGSKFVQFMTSTSVSARIMIDGELESELPEEAEPVLESPIEGLALCSPQAQLYARILHALGESVTVLGNINEGTNTLDKPQIIIVPAILGEEFNLDIHVGTGFTVIVDSPEVKVVGKGGRIYDFTTGNANITGDYTQIGTERALVSLDDQTWGIINMLVEMTRDTSIPDRWQEIMEIVREHNWNILQQTKRGYIEEPTGVNREAVLGSGEDDLLNRHSGALREREVEAGSLSARLERALAPKPLPQPSLQIWETEELRRAQEMRLALSALDKLGLRQKTAPVAEELLGQGELGGVPDCEQGILPNPQELTTVADDTSSISDRERWLAEKQSFYRRLLSGEPAIPAQEGKPGRRAIPGVYGDLPEAVITQIIDQGIPLEEAYKDFSITRGGGRAVVEGIIRVYEDDIRRTKANEKGIPFVCHSLGELEVKYPQVFMYL